MQTHTQGFLFTVINQKQEGEEAKRQVTAPCELTGYKTSFPSWKHVCAWWQTDLRSKYKRRKRGERKAEAAPCWRPSQGGPAGP